MEQEHLRDRLVFIAGMPRSGTTFLYHNLQKHPGIYAPRRKETCYFAHNYAKGESWFHSLYSEMNQEPVAIDVCGLYFMDEEACERIREFNPNSKIIIGLRDPVRWIFSLHEHYQTLFDVPDFPGFLEGCTVDREGGPFRMDFERPLVERAVRRFHDAFGDNLLLYDFSLLKENALGLLQKIESFTGLDPYFSESNFTNAKINARGRKTSPWVDHLLHKRGVANFISRVVPRRLLMAMRSYLDVASVKHLKKGSDRPKRQRPAEHLELAQAHFASDVAFLEKLFTDSPFAQGLP